MDGQAGSHWAVFHQSAALCGLWLLVLFVGVHTMSAMRAVLTPLLWAFFLMMGLVPATDAVERLLLRSCTGAARLIAVCCRAVGRRIPWCRRCGPRPPSEAAGAGDCGSRAGVADAPIRLAEGESEDGAEEAHRSEGQWRRQIARFFAVVFVIACFLGVIVAFFLMIVRSAEQMKSSWSWYRLGAKRIAKNINDAMTRISELVPPAVVDKVTANALESLEKSVSSLLKPAVENVTSMLVEVVMMLLYMVFWLCNPIEINTSVAGLFKRYILLKGMVSAIYAACVWLLLYMLRVDLAVVFGCCTFFLNFVPEVGPFVAAVLPAPVILFDGRLQNPWVTLAIALGGELGLKFFFGNVFEVKLIESDHNMKMHPVVILFCVAFFGWVWGPTGMLLSVPIMATLKAGAMRETLPPVYRNVFLRLLEGSKQRGAASEGRPASATASSSEVELGPGAVFEQVVRMVSSIRSPTTARRPDDDSDEMGPASRSPAAASRLAPGGRELI